MIDGVCSGLSERTLSGHSGQTKLRTLPTDRIIEGITMGPRLDLR